MIPVLVLGGLSTYRESLDLATIISAIAAPTMTVLGIYGLFWSDSVHIVIVSFLILSPGVIWTAEIGVRQLVVLTQLLQFIEGRDDALAKKVKLVELFGDGLLVIVVSVVGCGFTSWALEGWPITSAGFLECGICALVILEMRLFLFRVEYEGAPLRIDTSTSAMHLLEDPLGSHIALVSSPVSW
jgi:hypothetical protein